MKPLSKGGPIKTSLSSGALHARSAALSAAKGKEDPSNDISLIIRGSISDSLSGEEKGYQSNLSLKEDNQTSLSRQTACAREIGGSLSGEGKEGEIERHLSSIEDRSATLSAAKGKEEKSINVSLVDRGSISTISHHRRNTAWHRASCLWSECCPRHPSYRRTRHDQQQGRARAPPTWSASPRCGWSRCTRPRVGTPCSRSPCRRESR